MHNPKSGKIDYATSKRRHPFPIINTNTVKTKIPEERAYAASWLTWAHDRQGSTAAREKKF